VSVIVLPSVATLTESRTYRDVPALDRDDQPRNEDRLRVELAGLRLDDRCAIVAGRRIRRRNVDAARAAARPAATRRPAATASVAWHRGRAG
jgi:hypothetical protein